MYEHLKSIGLDDTDHIERYALRSESDNDILKVYLRKKKGELFAKSLKFKFPRTHKHVHTNSSSNELREITEISPTLRYIMEELDDIVRDEHDHKDAKQKILSELRHLEKVVSNKISEIEAQLDKI